MTLEYIIDSAVQSTLVVAGGGSVFYFLKGALLNSDSESNINDIAAGAEEFNTNLPRILRWAAWSGVQSGIDLGMQHVRHADDPLNLTVAWGAANALFSVPRGPRAAVHEGLKGGAVGGVVGFALLTLLHLVCSKKR
jgi:hypothetical protein